MTVAVTRTKVEQAYSESFEAVAEHLLGGPAIAEARKAAIGTFAGLGLPHRRIEAWKYTDLRAALKEALPPAVDDRSSVTEQDVAAALGDLAALDAHRIVFVNGAYRREPSTDYSAEGLEVMQLASVLLGNGPMRAHAETPDAMLALNTAFVTDGAVVRVGEGVVLAKPLLLVFAHAGREPLLVTTRNIIEIGAGAKATLIEAHVTLPGAAGGQANALSEIKVGDSASLVHVKCTLEGSASAHVAGWLATVGAEASYRAFQLTAATGLVRNNLLVIFAGEGAKLDISGCFLGRDAEHIDTTLVVDHAVPGCESRELFKGVLAGRARGVFQGKVIVRPDAQKTDGKQMAQVLMLSEDAEFDSKPELEIHADDVVCGHGSTTAEIDPEMLFYLRSRGIPVEQARALLIESFVGEALDKIEDERLRAALAGIATARLAGLAS
jgi:Fe-S cluster assembly protein SufD